MARPVTPADQRFIPKVDMRGDDECWPWTGSRMTRSPYGKFRFSATTQPNGAHRFAYQLWCGPLVDGLEIMHTCDNPPCCNPKHLAQVPPIVNIHDRDRKGRNWTGPYRPSLTATV